MRAVVESELGITARRVVKRAAETGWVTVGVVSTWVEDGQAHELLSLRGRRGDGRYVVTFVDGSVDGVWWWTCEHSAAVAGYREVERIVKEKSWSWHISKKLERDPAADEVVTWRTELPTRVKLGSLSALVGVAGGKRPRPGLLDTPVLTLDSEATQ